MKKIVEKEINGKKIDDINIFFTNKIRIDTSPNNINERIKIFSKTKIKIKSGKEVVKKMINRQTKKLSLP